MKYLDSSKAVLSTGKDGFIKMSDFSTLELKKSFRISDMPLSCFAEIGKELYVVGGWNSCLHLFNMNYGSSLQVFEAHDDAVSNILYIPSKVNWKKLKKLKKEFLYFVKFTFNKNQQRC